MPYEMLHNYLSNPYFKSMDYEFKMFLMKIIS